MAGKTKSYGVSPDVANAPDLTHVGQMPPPAQGSRSSINTPIDIYRASMKKGNAVDKVQGRINPYQQLPPEQRTLTGNEFDKEKPGRIVKPDPLSGFAEDNKEINNFALTGPDEMACVLIFVLATQQKRWPVIYPIGDPNAGFVGMMNYILKHSSNLPARHADNVPWKEVSYRRWESIVKIWNDRAGIFTSVAPPARARDTLMTFEALLDVPGLQLAKAGFATQLIIGKLGCIDSINIVSIGGPGELLQKVKNPKKPGTYSWGFKPARRNAKRQWTDMSRRMIDLYVHFVESLDPKHFADSTERLWDVWCAIVAQKMIKAQNPRGILAVDEYDWQGKPTTTSQGNYPAMANLIDPARARLKQTTNPAKEVSRQHRRAVELPFEAVKKFCDLFS